MRSPPAIRHRQFSVNGMQVFDPAKYAERVGLLLMNDALFMGWTSHCDQDPYTGWLMMYNARTLRQKSVLNLTPNGEEAPHYQGGEGSIWMAGAGLAGDERGNVYFLDANGIFDSTLDSRGFPIHADFGNAFMKVSSVRGRLIPADYFSTFDTLQKSLADQDLGSGGVLLLPDVNDSNGVTRHLAVGAGKDGNIYVVDRDNMGKFNASSNNIYQQLTHVLSGEFGMPAYFNGTVYYGSINSTLQAFTLQSGELGIASSRPQSLSRIPDDAVVSANSMQNGIVWAVKTSPLCCAYDATNRG